MNFDSLVILGRSFFYQHTIIAICILVGLVAFACFKPKIVMKIGVFAMIMGVLFYIISLLGGTLSTGVKHKDTLTERSQEANELNR